MSTTLQTVASLAKRSLFPLPSAQIKTHRGRRYVDPEQTELLLTADAWLRQGRYPCKYTEAIEVDGIKRYRLDQTEEAISESAWNKRGRKLAPGARPVGHLTFKRFLGGHYDYDVFPESATVERRAPAVVAPPRILDDLLACLFTINRASKRRRDAAFMQYNAGNHGFARNQREEKERLYRLKECGLRVAIQRGLLHCDGIHGNLGSWSGNGYRFHALFAPVDIAATASQTSEEAHFSDAKPKGSTEPRLMDAMATIEALEQGAPTLEALGLRWIDKGAAAPWLLLNGDEVPEDLEADAEDVSE